MSIQDKYEQMLFTTVRVETDTGTGSGVIIDKFRGYVFILTAQHVVKDGKEFFVTFYPDQDTYPAELLKLSPDHDLAILQVKHNHKYVANWHAPFEPLIFTEVYKIGASLGSLHPRVTNGLVSDVDEYGFIVSAPVVFGDSGGGIFMEDNGEYVLIGIVKALGVAAPYGMPLPVFHVGYITDMFAAEELFKQKESGK
jgi:S1-C subfamily serine protease